MEQREIKFRAWNRESKEFSYHDLINDDTSFFGDCIAGCFNKKQFILQQFTGLLDENGKEIYEGDIVLSHPEEGQKKWSDTKGVIVFHDTSYKIEIFSNHPTPPYCLITIFTPEHFGIGLEIIGNIYENPELLNQ